MRTEGAGAGAAECGAHSRPALHRLGWGKVSATATWAAAGFIWISYYRGAGVCLPCWGGRSGRIPHPGSFGVGRSRPGSGPLGAFPRPGKRRARSSTPVSHPCLPPLAPGQLPGAPGLGEERGGYVLICCEGGALGGLWFGLGLFCFVFLLALLVKKSHLFTKPRCPHRSPPPAELPKGAGGILPCRAPSLVHFPICIRC